MLSKSNELCSVFHKTYNAYSLRKYPDIEDIFFSVRDLYEKNPKKYKKANKTLLSLVYNIANPEYQPIVDYITGPGDISKWESAKYGKVIYLLGENHSNTTGCFNRVNLYGKKHMFIEKYLLTLFKHSPVFIDFYVEFPIMLDRLEVINPASTQTLWDMLLQMKGCFGPLRDRECPYNVRMHSIDTRRILSDKYKSSDFSNMQLNLMMQNISNTRNQTYIAVDDFKKKYKDQIDMLSKVKNNVDLVKIIKEDIENNLVITKELHKSTLPKKEIIDFFVNKEIKINSDTAKFIGNWFKSLKLVQKWPDKLNDASNILTMLNSLTVDVYTISRMFKVFNVKEYEHYPKEVGNIIYYAGDAHTERMGRFLKKLGFNRIEYSNYAMFTCVSMNGIKQPLFLK
jgi:hypothetical protein